MLNCDYLKLSAKITFFPKLKRVFCVIEAYLRVLVLLGIGVFRDKNLFRK